MTKYEDIEYLNKSRQELLKALDIQMQKTSKHQSRFISTLKKGKFDSALQALKIIQGEHVQLEKILKTINDK